MLPFIPLTQRRKEARSDPCRKQCPIVFSSRMSPKKTGRAKGPAPPPQPEPQPEEELQETHPDEFLEVEIESFDAPVDRASVSSGTKKKRVRESKKDIPDYNWTEDNTHALAEFIKDHHCLYDKRAKLWLNLQAKNALWEEIGQQLIPPPSGKCYK